MSDVTDVSLVNLNDCGCCEGIHVETPAPVYNRPGLSAITYRVGTHSQFKDSMLARLSLFAQDYPALQQLKTRDDNDFSLALLDAWAAVADVLTFYQERIANESYLRTATERVSLIELAQLIGYKMRPGVAASTYLAFTVEDAKGAPGHATIDIGTKVQSIPGPSQLPQTFETIEKITAKASWNALKPQTTHLVQPKNGDTQAYLKGTTTGLKPSDGILFVGSEREGNTNSEQWDFRQVTTVTLDNTNGRTLVTWNKGLGTASINPPAVSEVYTFRKRAALFGANAPDVRTLPDSVLTNYGLSTGSSRANEWNFGTLGSPFNLDTTYAGIVQGSWIVFSDLSRHALYRVNSVLDTSQNNYTLTSKTTRITPDTTKHLNQFGSPRGVVVFAQSEKLDLAEIPITPSPLQAGVGTIALSQAAPDLQANQTLVISGMAPNAAASDPAISEIVAIKNVSSDGMVITLSTGLQNSYDPTTVRINANVALATHGETVLGETLGSGDASQSYQQFTLRQPPLTYISSATASGEESTLTVRVNDIEWHEVPTLYGHGPRNRIFVTNTNDNQKTSIEFGDGVTGARLPTGQGNVRATYRKGIGTAGLVKAGQLSLLMMRPLGVKAVTNPVDASGAADPEGLDATGATDPKALEKARLNVPLTILTLDRIVSLQDYEDFARAFSGIAKALATWTWSGQVRGVFVTVAGANGLAVGEGSPTYNNLLSAMQMAGDPYVPLRVQTYRQAYFRIAARVKVAPDYSQHPVLTAVENALRDAFSFDARAFGQPVTQSEVIATMQAVPGVVAVDLYKLYRPRRLILYDLERAVAHNLIHFFPPGSYSQLNSVLVAAVPQPGAEGSIVAAELLTLDPAPLDDLGVMP
ncbi:putative baseplate assembly protein [Ktedonobacter racemifer]|uniref:Baseplate protein J-like domain-containing protein n=1 Tax=Ktedonobacter racemifer DSM 44963 TaxID=485913 RepID=D6TXD3_KTERA|nr:putative baseplate assembly protein [Ktedonobacter racemifer]EFH84866.1 conserved hypothetical protein [Ktedonobacter racemifer DSM 44963]